MHISVIIGKANLHISVIIGKANLHISAIIGVRKPHAADYCLGLKAPSLASKITVGSFTSTVCHTPSGIWHA